MRAVVPETFTRPRDRSRSTQLPGGKPISRVPGSTPNLPSFPSSLLPPIPRPSQGKLFFHPGVCRCWHFRLDQLLFNCFSCLRSLYFSSVFIFSCVCFSLLHSSPPSRFPLILPCRRQTRFCHPSLPLKAGAPRAPTKSTAFCPLPGTSSVRPPCDLSPIQPPHAPALLSQLLSRLL